VSSGENIEGGNKEGATKAANQWNPSIILPVGNDWADPEGRKQLAGHHRTSYYRCEKSPAEKIIV
jgi:hypothetical protein